MGCRYLNEQGHIRYCSACKPERSPTRAELKGLCQTEDQSACDFHRFNRATGRPLLLEDYFAWQNRRRRAVPPVEIDILP